VIVALLKAGANAKQKNSKGFTAIDYAKAHKDLDGTDAFKQLEEASK
jgi:ankyrin repeat protein